MKKIHYLILHCSATEEGRDFKASDLDRWHRAQGWRCCGYHYVIELDGTCRACRKLDETGAHCKGHNTDSIGICYIGGLRNGKPHDTRTAPQRLTLQALLTALLQRFPDAVICGHRDFAPKACPSFDAEAWAQQAGFPYRNIYHPPLSHHR